MLSNQLAIWQLPITIQLGSTNSRNLFMRWHYIRVHAIKSNNKRLQYNKDILRGKPALRSQESRANSAVSRAESIGHELRRGQNGRKRALQRVSRLKCWEDLSTTWVRFRFQVQLFNY
ncbi:unnamed protein product [Ceratitis capitata]|uniref:(Mediterranean fruit fly) hypothetical protein n=1 Tax=Ceratitis capitata TaxID=7213 RepID=A0A811VGD8_CERCA|nr:unnamed protein product [Ceratitis capitata]